MNRPGSPPPLFGDQGNIELVAGAELRQQFVGKAPGRVGELANILSIWSVSAPIRAGSRTRM